MVNHYKLTHALSALTLGALLTASSAFAGTVYAPASKESKPLVEEVKKSCITGDIGVNIVSQYITRGYVQENQSVIAQPFADLYFKLYEGEGFINSLTLTLGVWASIHEEQTFALPGSTTPSWYEFDYYPGIAIGFAENFTLSVSYQEYLSPNDAFATSRLIQAKLAYSDKGLLGPVSINPYVKAEYFIDAPEDSWYFEVGIAPSVPIGPVTLTLPVIAGFGTNDFYASIDAGTGEIENEAFGYLSAGANLSYALPFVPECLGTWTVNGGTTYYYLGDGVDGFNVPAVRDFDEHEWVFSGGLTVAF